MSSAMTSFRRLQAKGGGFLFAQISYYPAAGSAVFSSTSGSFDLVLTDGQQVNVAQGVSAESIASAVPSKLAHALEALSDLVPLSHQYTYELKHGTSLVIQWQQKDGTSLSLNFAVQPAADPGEHVCGLLGAALDNVASLKASTEELQQQCREFEAEAVASQRLVREYVEKKEEQDREMNIKVAALLNSKKEKLREMRRELEALKAAREEEEEEEGEESDRDMDI